MEFIAQSIEDIVLIAPEIQSDHGDYFVETFRQTT
jgi:dTDP-4-dehydrorhamnose 3,5-epimerase-like enzyme